MSTINTVILSHIFITNIVLIFDQLYTVSKFRNRIVIIVFLQTMTRSESFPICGSSHATYSENAFSTNAKNLGSDLANETSSSE